MSDAVPIEMFLDVSCPWCHGALETNRRLLDELAADPDVPPLAVRWRFMRLHDLPRPGGLPIEQHYRSFPGASDESVAAMRAEVQRYVTSVGVRVDEARFDFLHDPTTAHRLLAAVRDDGGDDQPGPWSLARAVFSANFVHGVDMSDLAALRAAVEQAGLAVAPRTWTELEQPDGHLDAVHADRARAREVELDGVPRMVVAGRIVPTWVDPDEVRRALREAIAAASAPTTA